jgi:ketosteroid isomerase-like protein
MSQANVEIAKRLTDAFNRREVETLLDLTTADCEMTSKLLDARAEFHGREGLESYYGMLADSWEEFQAVAEEYRDLSDRVLVLGRLRGHGKGSGVPVEGPSGVVLDFREGKISRIRLFVDHGEALRAAGLAE